jgi:hypothetical protein
METHQVRLDVEERRINPERKAEKMILSTVRSLHNGVCGDGTD